MASGECRLSIGKDVSRALKWSTFGKFSSQIVTWAITLIVIRILEPKDYGLIAIASSFITLFTLVSDMGLGAALVQAEQITTEKIRAIQGAVFLSALVIVGTILILAPAISLFFEVSQLSSVLSALAVLFLIEAFRSVPHNLLVRALDFKKIAWIELVSRILGAISTLALALYGAGVWALVLGNLIAHLVGTIGTVVSTRYSPVPSFRMRVIVNEFRFGASILGQSIIWWVYSQADVFIVGKMLSVYALGLYSIASHLAKLPLQKVGEVVNQVTLSAFSKSRNDPDATLSQLRTSVSFLFITSFPIFFGISSVAQEVTDVILGPQWSEAVVPIVLIPLIMPLRLVSAPLSQALNALGKPNVVIVNLAISAVVIPSGLFIGVQWGVEGVCWALVICSPITFCVTVLRGAPYTGFGGREVLVVLWRPFVAAALMYGVVFASRFLMPDYLTDTARFAVLVGIGGAAYLGVILVLAGDECRKLISFVRSR